MLPNWYIEYKKLIDDSVKNYLTKYFKSEKNPWLNIIKQASLYATKWWKRIRSILALLFYLEFLIPHSISSKGREVKQLWLDDDIIKFCVALELLHAYSLVHDDLPAMDNDILRRWEETTWKKFGETNAILVGDLLNSLAFELLADIWNIEIIKNFWKAVNLNWMLWWQVLDIFYENDPEKLTLENLIDTHNKKTWALIIISIIWWIILSWYKWDFEKYEVFWKKIWLAFQIKDDLLDVEWTKQETGKSVGDWEQKGFVYFLWLEKTHKYLDDLIYECKQIIKELDSEKLDFLINYIANRKK